jgi:cytochrome c oxidase subunit II
MTRLSIRRTAVVASILLSGCQDAQSVLAPQGPHAMQIAQLAWLLFAVGAAVLLVVVIVLYLAMRGSAEIRSHLATQGTVIAAGIAFPATVLTGLLGYGVWLTQASIPTPEAREITYIEVTGEQWWWRIAYSGAGGIRIASANEIRIPVGREIELTLKSADVIHSFWIPALAGKVDMIPGRTTRLRLRSDRSGVFRGPCAEYCGGAHALMAIQAIALPEREFEAALEAEAAPAAEPTTDAGTRGKALFLAAGCGACHAVRGTAAAGSVGPDLTHIGARRSVGTETLPMTKAGVVRFVVDGQHVKPGNNMPPFRIFSPVQLDELAAYLVELR